MIELSVVQRKNPQTKEIAYYPAIKGTKPANFRSFIDAIVAESTVTRPDVMATISALEEQVEQSLLNGETVRFKYLGSFRLTAAKNEGEADEKKVSAQNIGSLRVQFKPGTEMYSELAVKNNPNVRLILKKK